MKWSSRETRNNGFAILGLSTLFFVITLINGDPPPRPVLVEATGQLRYLEKVINKGSLDSLRFALTSDQRHFQYISSGGEIYQVLEALEHAKVKQIKIAFDPADSHRPPGDDRALYTVYELAVEKHLVRSYVAIQSRLKANNAFGLWAACGLGAIGILVLAMHFGSRHEA